MKYLSILLFLISFSILGIQYYDAHGRKPITYVDGTTKVDGIMVDITTYTDGSSETKWWDGHHKTLYANGNWEEFTVNNCGQKIITQDYNKCTGRIRTLWHGQLQ